ncbi:carbohydrate-binding domain-containing protein [[Ruminococcus] lactaris]|uniref:carbohydrate-binding domain-containing protein n=1 Tax=[Ruminococcus] lactaris TaxID=46228 RepID=UPI003FD84366
MVQADGGSFDISTSSTETDTSTKGIKAQKYVILKDGTYQLATADDGIHCNGNVYVCGGTYSINSGDDGIHADDQTVVLDGKIDITNCYEGIEGQSVTIQDGTIKIVSSDDGLNAAGGNDQSSMGRPGENTFQEDSDAYIDILGGTIEIDAKGDGIDSNGDFSVSGGVIYVSGPGDDGNGALDYDGTATITGGTVVAAGMSGMAQNFGSDSTQGTMLINLDTDQSGEITLKDTDGTVLVSYTPVRDFNSVVISCEELEEGAAYTLTTGLESEKITMSSLVYSEGQSMQGPGQGGPRMDGQNGQP